MAEHWYYQKAGMQFGPVDGRELKHLVASRIIGPDDLVRSGNGPWIAARDVPGLFSAAAPSGSTTPSTKAPPVQKSSTAQQPAGPSASPKQSAAATPAPPTGDVAWYVQTGGNTLGPLSTDQLIQLAAQKQISPADAIRTADSPNWIRAGDIADLFDTADSSSSRKGSSAARQSQPHAVNPSEVARETLANIHLRGLQHRPGAKKSKADDPGAVSEALTRTAGDLQERLALLRENCVDAIVRFFGLMWRFLESKVAVGLVLCALVGVGLYFFGLPTFTSNESAYDTYVAIRDELRQLRAEKASEERWDQFAQSARNRIEPIVKALEKKGNFNDRASLSLLWIGRDYLPRMLNDAREQRSESEQHVETHLAVVREAIAQERRVSPRVSPVNLTMVVIVVFDGLLVLGALFWLARYLMRKRNATHG